MKVADSGSLAQPISECPRRRTEAPPPKIVGKEFSLSIDSSARRAAAKAGDPSEARNQEWLLLVMCCSPGADKSKYNIGPLGDAYKERGTGLLQRLIGRLRTKSFE